MCSVLVQRAGLSDFCIRMHGLAALRHHGEVDALLCDLPSGAAHKAWKAALFYSCLVAVFLRHKLEDVGRQVQIGSLNLKSADFDAATAATTRACHLFQRSYTSFMQLAERIIRLNPAPKKQDAPRDHAAVLGEA